MRKAIDTTTPGGKVCSTSSRRSRFERSMVRERTRAGLDVAGARGRVDGRPRSLTDEDLEIAKTLLANPDITVEQVATHLGLATATLYLSDGCGSIHALVPDDEVLSFSPEPRRASKMK